MKKIYILSSIFIIGAILLISWYVLDMNRRNSIINENLKTQAKSDYDVGQWQKNNETNYPWLKKLPIFTKDYFVYFDLEKKMFEAKIYDANRLNTIKQEIISKLKELGSGIEKYQIEWIFPNQAEKPANPVGLFQTFFTHGDKAFTVPLTSQTVNINGTDCIMIDNNNCIAGLK